MIVKREKNVITLLLLQLYYLKIRCRKSKYLGILKLTNN